MMAKPCLEFVESFVECGRSVLQESNQAVSLLAYGGVGPRMKRARSVRSIS